MTGRIPIRSRARSYLELAGCRDIFAVSSYTGEGVDELSDSLHKMVEKYKEENARAYEADYFDLMIPGQRILPDDMEKEEVKP